MGGFIRNETYYAGIVYEWDLPTGSSCPFAKECKVTVDRETGKFDIHDGEYRCYAAAAERFPAVRQHRWENFEFIRAGGTPQLPADCKAVRIHSSGDFFNQEYFDLWCWIAKQNPTVEFWAFTKSIQYVVNRLNVIPDNLTITASFGGHQDHLIMKHNLKPVIYPHCRAYDRIEDVPSGMPIDTNDNWARNKHTNFALLNNKEFKNITTIDFYKGGTMLRLNELVSNEKNPRKINPDQFKKLVESVEKFTKMMAIRPIIVDENNVILGGSMRYRALLELGYTEVPDEWVKRVAGLSEQDKKEFIIRDNHNYGEWDWLVIHNDFSDLNFGAIGIDLPPLTVFDRSDPTQATFNITQSDIEAAKAKAEEQFKRMSDSRENARRLHADHDI